MENKRKINTISKGCRLRNSTHKLIHKIQLILQCTKDAAIGNACIKYYNEIRDNKILLEDIK